MTSVIAWGGAAALGELKGHEGVIVYPRYLAHATGEGDYVRLRETFKAK